MSWMQDDLDDHVEMTGSRLQVALSFSLLPFCIWVEWDTLT